MQYNSPTLLIVSGANGVGKSTHIKSMLPTELRDALPFDRDKVRESFRKELTGKGSSEMQAAGQSLRLMENHLEEKMTEAIRLKKHFVLETPLSYPDYWRYIDKFQNASYKVELNYICLNNVEECIERVAQRVREGGHHVKTSVIKDVYKLNLKYINDYYKTFDSIKLFDGKFSPPKALAEFEKEAVVFADMAALNRKWIKDGLENIAGKVAEFLKPELEQANAAKEKNTLKKRRGISFVF